MASDTLTAFHEKFNEAKTSYNQLRQEINSKLNECSNCLDTIEKLHREAGKMTINLEEELANALNDEKEWQDIKAKLAKLSTKGIVKLNVGGVSYATGVDTLTREKDTFFTALFSEQWKIERDDNDKSIFIDRNGKLFTYILEYLRTDLVPKDVMKNESLHKSVLIEAEYFRLHSLIKKLDLFVGGTLLTIGLGKKLNEFYGKQDQRWTLIYKASRDGFDANAFHTHCNNKGPTITIVQSNTGYLFGGYTAVAWTSDGNYKNDTTAFLFTLTNPHNIPSTKYPINPGNAGNAVYHHSGYGPTFGSGHDLHLVANSNSSNSSIGFPNGYIDTTGKGKNTFTGSSSFLTFDIEVFKLI
jgi:hypothetical protein